MLAGFSLAAQRPEKIERVTHQARVATCNDEHFAVQILDATPCERQRAHGCDTLLLQKHNIQCFEIWCNLYDEHDERASPRCALLWSRTACRLR